MASIGIFALPALMDRSMRAEVEAGKLPDLTVFTSPLALDRPQLAALASLPNVRAVEPRSAFDGQVYIGERRAPVEVVGVPDFGVQRVDVVRVASGAAPRANEVLTERQNANQGLLDAGAGDTVHVIATSGVTVPLRVSGEGRNLGGGKDATDANVVVLYATPETVALLSGVTGYQSLAFRLADTRPAAIATTTAAIRRALVSVPGFNGFTWLPEVRAAGDWPGKSDFQAFSDFFYVITVLALLSAFVLIANTMTTLVAEQTSEIGTMKALGGRRRQIAAVYVKTALLLGALGTVVGVVLGIALSNLLVRYLGSTFFAIDVGFGVDATILAVSVLVGLIAPALAALPAIRRAVRVPVREALEATGSAVGEPGRRRRDSAAHPRSCRAPLQIGLRNVGRRRRRSIATAVMVALAVGNLLAILGLAAGISHTTHVEWRDHGEDVKLLVGRRHAHRAADPVDARRRCGRADVRRADQGCRRGRLHLGRPAGDHVPLPDRRRTVVHPERGADARPRRRRRAQPRPRHRDTRRRSRPGRDRQRPADAARDRHRRRTSRRTERCCSSRGRRCAPRSASSPAGADDYWIRTTSRDHAFVDRTTTRLEDTMSAYGYDIGTEIEYVGEADNVASNRTITTSIAVLGFLIVAISMVGLANAITMSVIERTREVGILRTIGARARDIRRIFAAESVGIAVGGWLLGIPVGYLLDVFLVWMVKEVVNVTVPVTFPAGNIVLALVGTVVLAVLITLLPIRRAVRYRPGEALRYS